jgi:hypothetical protein
MERRTETKENASQQRTRRAQNRESVSQALERVRTPRKTRPLYSRGIWFPNPLSTGVWMFFMHGGKRRSARASGLAGWPELIPCSNRRWADAGQTLRTHLRSYLPVLPEVFCLIGPVGRCRERLAQHRDAGLDLPILWPGLGVETAQSVIAVFRQ